jgi:hypothetical protein
MLPGQLSADSFSGYPPEARALATQHIEVFRQLPITFVPLVLRELVAYDWKFPAERAELDFQLAYLKRKSGAELATLMKPFADLKVPDELAALDWVNVPAEFSERLSASLWASHQVDAFRKASVDYVHDLNAGKPNAKTPLPRLGVVVVGRDATASEARFRKLRALGVHYTNIVPQKASMLVDLVAARVTAHPEPFAHWYIDGADCLATPKGVTCVSYAELQPVRRALLAKMSKTMAPGGGGPELLRSQLQRTRPEDLGLAGTTSDPVLSHFELSLLTEGSGTQIFSTTFVQWTAREAWRRAQPYTLLARFAPRRREAAIGPQAGAAEEAVDPDGSLIDAEMGAYYAWINQQRLPNAEQSRFVVWYEGHNQAVAIAPALRAGSEETNSIRIGDLVANLS